MKKGSVLFTGLLVFLLFLSSSFGLGNVQAAEALHGVGEPDDTFAFSFLQENGSQEYMMSSQGNPATWSMYYLYRNQGEKAVTVKIKSSNEKIVKVKEKSLSIRGKSAGTNTISLTVQGIGAADIIASANGKEYRAHVFVVPNAIELISIEQTAYQSVTVKWKKASGCSGYYVERKKKNQENYQTVATVGAGKNSAVLKAKWGVEYEYRVIGYVKAGDQVHKGYAPDDGTKFTTAKQGAAISSVKRSGNELKIRWKPEKGAAGYKLYRSTSENGKYQCIYTAKSDKTSYSQKVSKGTTYYYKLVTVYPEGNSDFSPSVAQMIPLPKSAKAKVVAGNKITAGTGAGKAYYYQADGKLHIVRVQGNKNLKIFTLTSKMKVEKTKTVKLSYDYWGGFYPGPDGNFYVAVGYANPTESKNKTVIKVIKYNSKWKKEKTAKIKGGASNVFPGIYAPFASGNCQMDMQGNTLYLATSRTMFMLSDGLRHQSNISFKINTKTMKASEANDSYVSHSFNQYVKFKDGSLYVFDHGDAYPRALHLLSVDHYGKKDQAGKGSTLFEFQGRTGENYTGCNVGGMEVGGKNVIVCGRAKPHKYKIKGVSGYGSELAYNIFVTVTNRKTGKSTVKWLTNYHPKTSKTVVGIPRMVKLADSRFAIMYTTSQKGNTKLHYVVVDGSGKKVYSTTYKNTPFYADSQPILSGGYLVWFAEETSYEWGLNGLAAKTTRKICRIPAKY